MIYTVVKWSRKGGGREQKTETERGSTARCTTYRLGTLRLNFHREYISCRVTWPRISSSRVGCSNRVSQHLAHIGPFRQYAARHQRQPRIRRSPGCQKHHVGRALTRYAPLHRCTHRGIVDLLIGFAQSCRH